MCIENVCVNTHMSVYVVKDLVELWVKVSAAFIRDGDANDIRVCVIFIWDGEM